MPQRNNSVREKPLYRLTQGGLSGFGMEVRLPGQHGSFGQLVHAFFDLHSPNLVLHSCLTGTTPLQNQEPDINPSIWLVAL